MAELTDTQRAVLLMLATAPRGYSLPTVMARGFAYEMLQDLVRAGLASVRAAGPRRYGEDKARTSADHRGGTEGDRGMKKSRNEAGQKAALSQPAPSAMPQSTA